MQFSLGPLTIHLYGLLVGLAVAVGWWLVEKRACLPTARPAMPDGRQAGGSKAEQARDRRAQQAQLTMKDGEVIGWSSLIGGMLGARVWHLVTDWHLYQNEWVRAFFIWQGGLSILGAVAGGVLGAWLAWRWRTKNHPAASFFSWLDVVVFGLPFGQAVGRVANWVNQELYGLPTALPWGIYIEPAHRLTGWRQYDRFHPLFAYEMILTMSLGIGFWWFDRQTDGRWFGRGWFWWSYLLFYSAGRFGLDFLRLDKPTIGHTGLGVNQCILIIVCVVSFWQLLRSKHLSQKM